MHGQRLPRQFSLGAEAAAERITDAIIYGDGLVALTGADMLLFWQFSSQGGHVAINSCQGGSLIVQLDRMRAKSGKGLQPRPGGHAEGAGKGISKGVALPDQAQTGCGRWPTWRSRGRSAWRCRAWLRRRTASPSLSRATRSPAASRRALCTLCPLHACPPGAYCSPPCLCSTNRAGCLLLHLSLLFALHTGNNEQVSGEIDSLSCEKQNAAAGLGGDGGHGDAGGR
jgi:hypothetical protein